MYLLALLCPPLAVLLTGRLFQALFSLLLLPFYFPAALWALLVVASHKADKRAARYAQRSNPTTVTTNVQVNNSVHVTMPPGESDALVREILADQERAMQIESSRQIRAAELAALERRSARVAAIKAAPMRAMWMLDDARSGSIRAYHLLPEWAQPITWGLAIGTPFSLIAMAFFLRR